MQKLNQDPHYTQNLREPERITVVLFRAGTSGRDRSFVRYESRRRHRQLANAKLSRHKLPSISRFRLRIHRYYEPRCGSHSHSRSGWSAQKETNLGVPSRCGRFKCVADSLVRDRFGLNATCRHTLAHRASAYLQDLWLTRNRFRLMDSDLS